MDKSTIVHTLQEKCDLIYHRFGIDSCMITRWDSLMSVLDIIRETHSVTIQYKEYRVYVHIFNQDLVRTEIVGIGGYRNSREAIFEAIYLFSICQPLNT